MSIKKIKALLLNTGGYKSLSYVKFPVEVVGYMQEDDRIGMQVLGDELMRVGGCPDKVNNIPAAGRYFANILHQAQEFKILEVTEEISNEQYQAIIGLNSNYEQVNQGEIND